MNKQIQERITAHLERETDRYLLPCYAQALYELKNQLPGSSPQDRYVSFFKTTGDNDQDHFLRFKQENSKLISSLLDRCSRISNNIVSSIHAAERDLKITVSDVECGISDFHNGNKQNYIFYNTCGEKIVFRNRPAEHESFFAAYLDAVGLDHIVKLPEVLYSGRDYSIVEFVEHVFTTSTQEVEVFYENAGALLAVMDSLNFTDGHFENLIAHKATLAPVDLETLFFSPPVGLLHKKNRISDTGLIGKNSLSVLSARQDKLFYPINPIAINDGTDMIEVRYRNYTDGKIPKSLPSPAPEVNIAKIISGYKMAVRTIFRRKEEALNIVSEYSGMKVRRILRPTVAYLWLMARYKHPSYKDIQSDKFLNIYPDEITGSEKTSLLSFDVPLFNGDLQSRAIFSDEKTLMTNFFAETGIEHFKRKIDKFGEPNFLINRVRQIRRLLLRRGDGEH